MNTPVPQSSRPPNASENPLPNAVASTIGDVLGGYIYNHKQIEFLFAEAGAHGDAPEGNCREKVERWLKREANARPGEVLGVAGRVLEKFMEVDDPYRRVEQAEGRERVRRILTADKMAYRSGGRLVSTTAVRTSAVTLEELMRRRDFHSVEEELGRALSSVDEDPRGALTAACALLEAVFKTFLEEQGQPLPSKQTVKPLFDEVRKHLGLDPSKLADDDLKKVLGGLAAIVDGIGAVRTHAGSAHGHGRKRYRVEPRHARLAVNGAIALTTFFFETWDARARASSTGK